ncbi:hypothetical protein V1281_002033 [Nitrobacteraceae bacterium AZCC 2161]
MRDSHGRIFMRPWNKSRSHAPYGGYGFRGSLAHDLIHAGA